MGDSLSGVTGMPFARYLLQSMTTVQAGRINCRWKVRIAKQNKLATLSDC